MDKSNIILLPGAAQDIPERPANWPAIQAMLAREGFYVLGDTTDPRANVPVVVIEGRAYSMTVDKPLNPTRFLPTATFAGPFFANTSDALDAAKYRASLKVAQARGFDTLADVIETAVASRKTKPAQAATDE